MSSGEQPEVRYTFKKYEKLCYRRSFDILFEHRQQVRAGRIRIVYAFDLPPDLVTFHLMVAFSVPKRAFKKAVDRNLLKRRLREATRLHKAPLIQQLRDRNRNAAILIIYQARRIEPYAVIEPDVIKGFNRLQEKLLND